MRGCYYKARLVVHVNVNGGCLIIAKSFTVTIPFGVTGFLTLEFPSKVI